MSIADGTGKEVDLTFELEGGLVFKGRGVITRKAPDLRLPIEWRWARDERSPKWYAVFRGRLEMHGDGSWLMRFHAGDEDGDTFFGPDVPDLVEVAALVKERNAGL